MKRLSLDQIDVDTTVQPVSQNRMTDVRHEMCIRDRCICKGWGCGIDHSKKV